MEPRNPTGKGGFQDHPELRATGKWQLETTPKALRRKYGRYTLKQLQEEMQRDDLTIFQVMVLQELADAVNQRSSTMERMRIRAEISDRVDGKPVQETISSVDVNALPSIRLEVADVSGSPDSPAA